VAFHLALDSFLADGAVQEATLLALLLALLHVPQQKPPLWQQQKQTMATMKTTMMMAC